MLGTLFTYISGLMAVKLDSTRYTFQFQLYTAQCLYYSKPKCLEKHVGNLKIKAYSLKSVILQLTSWVRKTSIVESIFMLRQTQSVNWNKWWVILRNWFRRGVNPPKVKYKAFYCMFADHNKKFRQWNWSIDWLILFFTLLSMLYMYSVRDFFQMMGEL